MDTQELHDILKKCGVDEVVVKWVFDANIKTVSNPRNWADEVKELKTKILQKTSKKDGEDQEACLKQAWRTCVAKDDTALAATGHAMPVASLGEPLEEGIQKTVEDSFLKIYNWKTIDSDERGCGAGRGRLWREFEASNPSQF